MPLINILSVRGDFSWSRLVTPAWVLAGMVAVVSQVGPFVGYLIEHFSDTFGFAQNLGALDFVYPSLLKARQAVIFMIQWPVIAGVIMLAARRLAPLRAIMQGAVVSGAINLADVNDMDVFDNTVRFIVAGCGVFALSIFMGRRHARPWLSAIMIGAVILVLTMCHFFLVFGVDGMNRSLALATLQRHMGQISHTHNPGACDTVRYGCQAITECRSFQDVNDLLESGTRQFCVSVQGMVRWQYASTYIRNRDASYPVGYLRLKDRGVLLIDRQYPVTHSKLEIVMSLMITVLITVIIVLSGWFQSLHKPYKPRKAHRRSPSVAA